MLKRVVAGLLVLVMLGSAVMPAMASSDVEGCGCGACEITLRRLVEVDIANNGRPILKVTEINQSLSDWFSENFNFSCADGSCLAFDYQIEVNELLNTSTNGKELKFLEVRVYNDTESRNFKLLGYFSETATYNLSLVTRIMEMDGESYFVTTINVAPKDSKKFAPFADIIEVKSKTTLAEHYRVLAKVLNEIKRGDETSWVWNKAKNELNYLSRVVERDLAEYNVEGTGVAITADASACMNLCNLICGFVFSFFCASVGGGWVGALICALGSSFICEGGCAQICQENPNLFSGGCSGGCNFICDQLFCKRLGPGRAICQTHICPLACSGACALV